MGDINMKDYFNVFDIDNSGFLDTEEVFHFCAKLGLKFTREQACQALDEMELDDSRDGKVSFREFESWWWSETSTKKVGSIAGQLATARDTAFMAERDASSPMGKVFAAVETKLRNELGAMKTSELRKRARALDGISERQLDEAADAENPKPAIVELIVLATRSSGSAILAAPTRPIPAQPTTRPAPTRPIPARPTTQREQVAATNWVEHYSELHSRAYWQNSNTGETTWVQPPDGTRRWRKAKNAITATMSLAKIIQLQTGQEIMPEETMVALQKEFATLSLSSLNTRARATGVSTAELDQAYDADNPRLRVIALIVDAELTPEPQAEEATIGLQPPSGLLSVAPPPQDAGTKTGSGSASVVQGIYSKFQEGGFVDSFATAKQFNDGVVGLLGLSPEEDLFEAIRREHCDRPERPDVELRTFSMSVLGAMSLMELKRLAAETQAETQGTESASDLRGIIRNHMQVEAVKGTQSIELNGVELAPYYASSPSTGPDWVPVPGFDAERVGSQVYAVIPSHAAKAARVWLTVQQASVRDGNPATSWQETHLPPGQRVTVSHEFLKGGLRYGMIISAEQQIYAADGSVEWRPQPTSKYQWIALDHACEQVRPLPSLWVDVPPRLQPNVKELWHCEHECGFTGIYSAVTLHEESCEFGEGTSNQKPIRMDAGSELVKEGWMRIEVGKTWARRWFKAVCMPNSTRRTMPTINPPAQKISVQMFRDDKSSSNVLLEFLSTDCASVSEPKSKRKDAPSAFRIDVKLKASQLRRFFEPRYSRHLQLQKMLENTGLKKSGEGYKLIVDGTSFLEASNMVDCRAWMQVIRGDARHRGEQPQQPQASHTKRALFELQRSVAPAYEAKAAAKQMHKLVKEGWMRIEVGQTWPRRWFKAVCSSYKGNPAKTTTVQMFHDDKSTTILLEFLSTDCIFVGEPTSKRKIAPSAFRIDLKASQLTATIGLTKSSVGCKLMVEPERTSTEAHRTKDYEKDDWIQILSGEGDADGGSDGNAREDVPLASYLAATTVPMETVGSLATAGVFAASDRVFTTSNYGGTKTTPKHEWMHVVHPEQAPALTAGKDHEGNDLGMRQKIPWQTYKSYLLLLLKKSYMNIGWEHKAEALTQKILDETVGKIEDGELVALRLYTGPCFMIYNTVLRAMGNVDAPGMVPAYDQNFGGQDVKNCYVSTIHAINHGTIKLSRLSVAKEVHRGFTGMKLPEFFFTPNLDGVRGGGEFGFMSTTAERKVALGYTEGWAGAPRTLLSANMDLANRGAFVGFISQYPEEVEFLYPPMCAMQVKHGPDERGDLLLFKMSFFINTSVCSSVKRPIGVGAAALHKDVDALIQGPQLRRPIRLKASAGLYSSAIPLMGFEEVNVAHSLGVYMELEKIEVIGAGMEDNTDTPDTSDTFAFNFTSPAQEWFVRREDWFQPERRQDIPYQFGYVSVSTDVVTTNHERSRKFLEMFMESQKTKDGFCDGIVKTYDPQTNLHHISFPRWRDFCAEQLAAQWQARQHARRQQRGDEAQTQEKRQEKAQKLAAGVVAKVAGAAGSAVAAAIGHMAGVK
jgi:hypothetical protein